jgi:eukaryotic-like serine/threonine-protein kinase
MIGKTISHYRILEKLGEGGMGVVYKAEDTKLHRTVALKFIRPHAVENPELKARFLTEAEAAAALIHPNICVVHEIDEADGGSFITMEYVEGQSLAEKMKKRPLPLDEALEITAQVAEGLHAAHKQGIVHRDIKPANIMIDPEGRAKIMDFGLAHLDTATKITKTGAVMGTPAYMSPEQALAQPTDCRTDIWSLGVVLYEMVTGQLPFKGEVEVAVAYSIVNDEPEPLTALRSGVPVEMDRVVEKALAKTPGERYQHSEEMVVDLKCLRRRIGQEEAPREAQTTRRLHTRKGRTGPVRRLMVLPFRMLRPNEEAEFLAFSLPDAVASALSGIEALIVRSPLAAAALLGEAPDLSRLAAETEVDAVLTGTLLAAGDQVRVTTQLIATPGGTLLHSQTSQASLQDLFQLQDDLVHRIVQSLALHLTLQESQILRHDVPATPTAYEYYLRANQLAHDWRNFEVARDLYLRSVEADPLYAPAWARLGRCYRVITKWRGEPAENLARAEQAFQRALDLNPDLALAHILYAHLEADLGRAQSAMVRLLNRAQSHSNDPELFAGLVQLCRYCGLLEASQKAHVRARCLDPKVPTSITHTYFVSGDDQRCVEAASKGIGDVDFFALTRLGRVEKALEHVRERERSPLPEFLRPLYESTLALLEGNRDSAIERMQTVFEYLPNWRDPEGLFYVALQLSRLGLVDRALTEIGNVIDQGYLCVQMLKADPWLEPLRARSEFARLLRRAEAKRQAAYEAFLQAGGEQVLGVSG